MKFEQFKKGTGTDKIPNPLDHRYSFFNRLFIFMHTLTRREIARNSLPAACKKAELRLHKGAASAATFLLNRHSLIINRTESVELTSN
jgi:hypothetical protein